MSSIQKLTSVIAALLLSFSLVLVPVVPVYATDNALTQDGAIATEINRAIKEASQHVLEHEVDSEWEVISLAKAGLEIPSSYNASFMQTLNDQVISKSGNGRMKITDVERLAITAVAMGKDPTNIDGKGFNLIEKIYNSEPWTTGADSLTFQGNNGIIFALIALDTKAFTVPNNAKWTREKLVAELLKYQKEDGSWGLSTSKEGASSFDITAMALIALAPYGNELVASHAIDKAITYLSNAQGPTGGFDEAFVGGISSEATAQVIIGLTANKVDPRSEHFTKNGINLIDHLLSFKATDGGYKHTAEDRSSNPIATEQALQALVAFDLYTHDKGVLYSFTEKNVIPKPDPGLLEFTDVKAHWAKDFIQQAAQLGIVKGYSDGSFKPDNALTRVQAVSVLVRALDLKTTDAAPFKDISSYAKETQAEIATAYKYGLVTKQDGHFNPSNKVTRAQMALMLNRAYEQKTGEKYTASKQAPFTDFGSYNAETVNAISMLYELDIATGSNGKYMPGNSTTRAHIAKMLINFLKELE